MTEKAILSKLSRMPEQVKKEALNFIEFLMYKHEKENPDKKRPKFGSAKGMYKMSEDFDEPLEDLKEYM